MPSRWSMIQCPCLQDHSRLHGSLSPRSCLLIKLVAAQQTLDCQKRYPCWGQVLRTCPSFTMCLPYLRYSAVPSSSLLNQVPSGFLLNNFQQPKSRSNKDFCQAVAAPFLQDSSMISDEISSLCSLKPFSSTSHDSEISTTPTGLSAM